MARIRTIKPEFWDSPSTAQADLAVRLTYIAMWNWADDSGRGTANIKELEAFVFPNDDVSELPRKSCGNSADGRGGWRSFTEVLGEVAEAYGVLFYKVKNRPYYVIPQFKDHQSRDFRPKSKYPTENEGEFYDVTSGNTLSSSSRETPVSSESADGSGTSADGSGNSVTVIGEEGNRGRGEQSLKDLSDSDESNDSDNPEPPKPAPKKNEYPDDFEAFWKAYPKKAGKIAAFKSWKDAKRKASAEDIIAGAERYANDPNRSPEYTKNAQGWLNDGRWMDEPLPPRNQQPRPTSRPTNTPEAWGAAAPAPQGPQLGWGGQESFKNNYIDHEEFV